MSVSQKKTLFRMSNYVSEALLIEVPFRSRLLLWLCFLFFVIALIWSSFASLDEVTKGEGKVIPSKQLQIIQNLEGGIVKAIFVQEGDHVNAGEELLQIDDTRFQSDFREQEQQLLSYQADIARERTELQSIQIIDKNDIPWRDQVSIVEKSISFPVGFETNNQEVIIRQISTYKENINNIKNQLTIMGQQIEQKENEILEINNKIRTIGRSVSLLQHELSINQPLVKEGIVSQVDYLKIQRQLNDAQGELDNAKLLLPKQQSLLRESIFKRKDVALKYRVDTKKDLDDKQNKLLQLKEGQIGLKDKVSRTSISSPVAGTVKTIKINTVGGVVQPGSDIIEIVPSEDNLLVETKISPKDIAFLKPGLKAKLKFSAYDFSIYGGLTGVVEHISADSITDDKGNSYYLIRVRTKENYLGSTNNKLPIIPGMIANVDVITGKKTILDYLMKPILRAKYSALQER